MAVEIVEGFPVMVSFFEYCQPAQPCLCTLKNQHFEKASIVMNGNTPFIIVICNVKGIVPAPFTSCPYFIFQGPLHFYGANSKLIKRIKEKGSSNLLLTLG
jgi:hypothetical protein